MIGEFLYVELCRFRPCILSFLKTEAEMTENNVICMSPDLISPPFDDDKCKLRYF